MGLIIYSKQGKNARGGSRFSYFGEFTDNRSVIGSGTIPSILESPEVAEALGVGTHELIVGFRTWSGAPPINGLFQWITREYVVIEQAPAPVRTTSVEALI